MKASEVGVWFLCKGCGAVCCCFEKGNGPHYPPGAVGHGKPVEHRGLIPVQCALWQQTDAAVFWMLHVDAERVEPPTKFEPIL